MLRSRLSTPVRDMASSSGSGDGRLLSRRAFPCGLMIRHDRVGRWEEDGFVPVLPVDQVRRAALLAVHLDDLAVPVAVALVPALDRKLVPDYRSHGSPRLQRSSTPPRVPSPL